MTQSPGDRLLQRLLRPKAGPGERDLLYFGVFFLALLAATVAGLETRVEVAAGVAALLTAGAAWVLSGRLTVLLTAIAVALIMFSGRLHQVPVSLSLVEALITVVMAALSHLSASNLSSARQAIEQERQVRELTFLLEAAQALAGSLDSDLILQTAVRATAQRVSRGSVRRPPRASFHRLEGERVTVTVAHDGELQVNEDLTYPLSSNQAALGAMRSGRAALVRPDHISGPLLDHVLDQGLLVTAMAPVRSGTQVFGFLAATARDRAYFDRDELRRLEVLAHMAGLAIGNAEHLRREQAHSERAAALERTKSELLNLVSHELRGPLTVIRGYLSMLDEGAFGDLPDSYRHDVLPILDGKLTSMDLLVEQTLEASRLEDSRLLLKREQVNLQRLLEDAVRTMRPLAARHDLTLEVPEEPVSVEGDAGRLNTIVVNLIDNAIKYSPEGGAVRCRLYTRSGAAYFAVSDEGVGIAREHLPQLFTRFGRIVTSDNSHIPGTGLGLYLSQELAAMHGGEITVASEPRRGSTFTLRLPLLPVSPNGAGAPGAGMREPRSEPAPEQAGSTVPPG